MPLCARCGGTEGYIHKNGAGRKPAWRCRSCVTERIAMWADRPGAVSHYGGKCSCCGEERQGFLCIESEKSDPRTEPRVLGSRFYAWLKREGYPAGYFVLCFNC